MANMNNVQLPSRMSYVRNIEAGHSIERPVWQYSAIFLDDYNALHINMELLISVDFAG